MSDWVFITYIVLGLLTLGWTCFVLINALAALFSQGLNDNQTKKEP